MKNEIYVVWHYFLHSHATCMPSHVLRVKGTGVQECKGKIPPDEHKRYLMLHKKSKVKSGSQKWVSDSVVEIVDSIQQFATASLQSACKKYTDQVVDSNQMCIEVRFERAVSNDIQCSYDAWPDMAIADFFHCENFPDNVMRLYWFKK